MTYQEKALEDGVWAPKSRRGISRRDFLRFATVMTGALALPIRYTSRIVKVLETTTRPSVVWFEFQDCSSNTESALRSSHPINGAIKQLNVGSSALFSTLGRVAAHVVDPKGREYSNVRVV